MTSLTLVQTGQSIYPSSFEIVASEYLDKIFLENIQRYKEIKQEMSENAYSQRKFFLYSERQDLIPPPRFFHLYELFHT